VQVFICYSHTDSAFVDRLEADLSRYFTVWRDIRNIPRDIASFTDGWDEANWQGLKESTHMVVVLSPDAMASKNVGDEWKWFRRKNRLIVPVIVRDTEVHFQLDSLHRFDFRDGQYPLADVVVALGGSPETVDVLPDPVDVLDILPPPFEWCQIPSIQGFELRTDEGNKGTYGITPFYMAKYPVTYAQFQVFIDAEDGFFNSHWWEGLAADDEHKGQPQAAAWPIDNHPRENVSWHDAVAFTRWLSSQTGTEIRLPTEWEWQWAAAGDTGWDYPYGPEFDRAKSNTYESSIGETTPVDRYPQGASPFRVLDMSGNVWEWCLNIYEEPANTDTTGDALRVVRGGAFNNGRGLARVSIRFRLDPDGRHWDYGFRVVLLPSKK